MSDEAAKSALGVQLLELWASGETWTDPRGPDLARALLASDRALAEAKAEIAVLIRQTETQSEHIKTLETERDQWHAQADENARLCGEAIRDGQRRESETEIRLHGRIAKLEAALAKAPHLFHHKKYGHFAHETEMPQHTAEECARLGGRCAALASPSEPAGGSELSAADTLAVAREIIAGFKPLDACACTPDPDGVVHERCAYHQIRDLLEVPAGGGRKGV